MKSGFGHQIYKLKVVTHKSKIPLIITASRLNYELFYLSFLTISHKWRNNPKPAANSENSPISCNIGVPEKVG